MNRHRELFKENSSQLSPRQYNRINRDLQNANRIKQRTELFHNTRKITLSPTPLQERPHETNFGNCASATSTPAAKKAPKPQSPGGNAERRESPASEQSTENKENQEEPTKTESHKDSEASASRSLFPSQPLRIARVACKSGKDSGKLSHQEGFLKRFIEWKKEKKMSSQKVQHSKARPFINVAKPSGLADPLVPKPVTSSFAPKGHQFRAPAGLKNPAAEKEKLRKSVYSVRGTPPGRDQSVHKNGQLQTRMTSVPLLTRLPSYGVPSHGSQTNGTKTPLPNGQPKAVAAKPLHRTDPIAARSRPVPPPQRIPKVTPKTAAKTTPQITAKATPKTSAKTPPKTAPKTTSKTVAGIPKRSPAKSTGAKANANAKPSSTFVKPRPFVLPPPPRPAPVTKAPPRFPKPAKSTGGAVGKTKQLENKRASPGKKLRAKLGGNLKSKRPAGGNKIGATANGARVPPKIVTSKMALLLPSLPLPVAETPTDCGFQNPFDAFVTSTNLKNSPSTMENVSSVGKEFSKISDKISPVKTLTSRRKARASSAKRALLIGEAAQRKSPPKVEEKRKFNFVRYSEVDLNDTVATPAKEVAAKEVAAKEVATEEVTAKDPALGAVDEQTPPKSATPRPSNYVSPFVSVSRGKVSLKKERERRNSVYLVTPEAPLAEPTAAIERRRALESVRYFRHQLSNEIARLEELCEKWERYKEENLERLEAANGDDMIHVTIGQTRLLISSKFKQFAGLIDRCEAGATGVGVVVNDGSEKTRPISTVDLEGFWGMVGLQVENVDKRFANLDRWRDNDWNDPEVGAAMEAVPAAKKKTRKGTKKAKASPGKAARPSSGLVQMMRKKQAEMRLKKAAELESEATSERSAAGEVAMGTPTQNRHQRRMSRGEGSTPRAGRRSSCGRRVSVVVRDRKSRSGAATVVSIPTSTSRRSSGGSQSPVPGTPKLMTRIQNINRNLDEFHRLYGPSPLLKTALLGATEERQQNEEPSTSPGKSTPPQTPAQGHKSILKTPGTVSSKTKNVIFNEQLRIRNFKFTVGDEDSESCEEGGVEYKEDNVGKVKESEETERTVEEEGNGVGNGERIYSLRHRTVKLRPSCEILIPEKDIV